MGIVKNFVMELEQEVIQLIEEKGVNFVCAAYGVPQGLDLDFDELVEFCVGIEYQNAFK